MAEGRSERGVVPASVRAREANRGVLAIALGSLALHLGAFGGVLYAASLKPRRSFEPTSIPVELVTLGKVRDPDLLPRKVKPPPPAPKASPAPEAAPAPEAKPPPEAVALDGPEKKTPKKRRPAPKRPSSAAQAILEGSGPDDDRLDAALDKLDERIGSPDGSAYGTTTDPSAAANTYEAKVKGVLQRRYELPMTVAPSQRRFLEAEVVLYIDGRGRVTRFEFLKRHDNQAFMNALEGLLRSVELPAPPRRLASTYAREGLAIRFKP